MTRNDCNARPVDFSNPWKFVAACDCTTCVIPPNPDAEDLSGVPRSAAASAGRSGQPTTPASPSTPPARGTETPPAGTGACVQVNFSEGTFNFCDPGVSKAACNARPVDFSNPWDFVANCDCKKCIVPPNPEVEDLSNVPRSNN